MSLPTPPSGILDKDQPWYRGKISDAQYDRLKAKLTGGRDAGGTAYSKLIDCSLGEAEKIISNMKKDPRGYPQMYMPGGGEAYQVMIDYYQFLKDAYLYDEPKPEPENIPVEVEVVEVEQTTVDEPIVIKIEAPFESTPEVKLSAPKRISVPRRSGVISTATKKSTAQTMAAGFTNNLLNPLVDSIQNPPAPAPPRQRKQKETLIKIKKNVKPSSYKDTKGPGFFQNSSLFVFNKTKDAFGRAAALRKQATEQGMPEQDPGFYLKRALGNELGGDAIARTRGTFSSNPDATLDPALTKQQRLSAGIFGSRTIRKPQEQKVDGDINNLTKKISEIDKKFDSLLKTKGEGPDEKEGTDTLEKTLEELRKKLQSGNKHQKDINASKKKLLTVEAKAADQAQAAAEESQIDQGEDLSGFEDMSQGTEAKGGGGGIRFDWSKLLKNFKRATGKWARRVKNPGKFGKALKRWSKSKLKNIPGLKGKSSPGLKGASPLDIKGARTPLAKPTAPGGISLPKGFKFPKITAGGVVNGIKGAGIGLALEMAGEFAIEKGLNAAFGTPKERLNRLKEKADKKSPEEREKIITGINAKLQKELEYQKSPLHLADKILRVGGQTQSEGLSKVFTDQLQVLGASPKSTTESSLDKFGGVPEGYKLDDNGKIVKMSAGGVVGSNANVMTGEAGDEMVITPENNPLQSLAPMIVAMREVTKRAGTWADPVENMVRQITDPIAKKIGLPTLPTTVKIGQNIPDGNQSGIKDEKKGLLGKLIDFLKGKDADDTNATSSSSPSGAMGMTLSGSAADLVGNDHEFLAEVTRLSQKYQIKEGDLLALMASESGLNPHSVNSESGATGLIQFIPSTARGLGTTTSALLGMTRAQQMKYVEKFFDQAKLPKGATPGQLYATVIAPAYASKDPDTKLYTRADGEAYTGNQALDKNNDGAITVREMGGRLEQKKAEFGISDSGVSPVAPQALAPATPPPAAAPNRFVIMPIVGAAGTPPQPPAPLVPGIPMTSTGQVDWMKMAQQQRLGGS